MEIRIEEVKIVGSHGYSGPSWLRKLAYKLGFSPTWKYKSKIRASFYTEDCEQIPEHGDMFCDELGKFWYSPCVYGSRNDKKREIVLESKLNSELGWGISRQTPYGQLMIIGNSLKEDK